jgi:hypothetical protein
MALGELLRAVRASLRSLTGRDLLPEHPAAIDDATLIRELGGARFVLLCHDTRPDPVFLYGNQTALDLFEVSWHELTTMPSRLSAEPLARDERTAMLERVATDGYIDDYRGVRVSSSGRRFLIEQAVVWEVVDSAGRRWGQAALFDRWVPLGGRAEAG